MSVSFDQQKQKRRMSRISMKPDDFGPENDEEFDLKIN
jgi:hypothetical protein